jgi:predicted DNA-binding transcriptional regulator AlpA
MARAQKRRARPRERAAVTQPHLVKPELSSREQPRRLDQSLAAMRVIDEHEAAEVLNLSVDTLRRRVRDGTGPKRIALSTRRVGYRVGDLQVWLDQKAV